VSLEAQLSPRYPRDAVSVEMLPYCYMINANRQQIACHPED